MVEKTFTISGVEIERRIKAFRNLEVFFVAGLVLSGLFLWKINVYILIPLGVIVLLCLFFFALTINSFKKISKTKYFVFDKKIERVANNTRETFEISKIEEILVKRTTNKTVRDVKIKFQDGQAIFVDGLADFEGFIKQLKVPVNETRERVDFDHPWFYIILGFVMGMTSNLLLKLFMSLNKNSMRVLSVGTSIYCLLLGLYFLASRPLSKRYGKKNAKTDYLFSIIFILASILFIF